MSHRSRILGAGWVLAFLTGLSLCKQPDWRPLQGLAQALITVELNSYDRRQTWRSRRDPDPRVVIVAIDVESLEDFGAMPWDRQIHARLVDRLRADGAGAVAFDIAFSGRRQSLSSGEAEQDQALIKAFRASGKVVVARYVDVIQRYDAVTGEPHIEKHIHSLPVGMLDALEGKRGVGLAFCDTDADHGVRTTWLRVSPDAFGSRAQDGLERIDYSPLAAQALNKLTNQTLEIASLGAGWQGFFGDKSLPVWKEAPILLLDYPGKPFPVYSYRDVLSGKIDASKFRGKLVIVGSTYDLADSFRVPRNPAGDVGNVPGCFVHATLADQLLTGHFLAFAPYPLEGQHATPWLMGYVWGSMLALAGLVAHQRMRFTRALKFNFVLFLCYGLLATGLMLKNTYLNTAIPLTMLVTAQLPLLAYELWQVRAMLRWFVPQEDVEGLMRSGGLATTSQSQIATVLFIDIRDYTTLSEKLGDPAQVRALVSRFHTVTAQVFERFGGYVCDFQGDAQMVAFGITPPNPHHASKAIEAGTALAEAVAKLNHDIGDSYPQLGNDPRGVFRFGVGICTGEVSVGYLQGGGKLQHTVLGDTTNTAARLQGLARDLGVITVVSYTSAERAPEWRERLRPLEAAKLKGKAEPHAIFELLESGRC